MLAFLQRFAPRVIGALSGLDRIRFRGTKRFLANVRGLMGYLWQMQILLKDFPDFATAKTEALRRGVEEQAAGLGRPVLYLNSSQTRKEEVALERARADGVTQGLIAVLSCVEPCLSVSVRRNRAAQKLELHYGPTKCLHYYHYYLDPQFGLRHVRTQTWFPFTVHACLNGREWLARQLDAARIGYVKRDNCFVDVADVPAAQALLDTQLRTDWSSRLTEWARQSNPAHDALFATCPAPYYWSVEESEWATDVLFRSPEELAAVMPRFTRHGLEALRCVDVLRFLGARRSAERGVIGSFQGEVVTDLKHRPEGVRLLHRVNRNWIKMYDKQGSVLRIETVLNDPRDLKVYRTKEGDEEGPKQWLRLRKGVADLHRRTEVSQKANERYLESLATVEESQPLGALTERLSRPVEWHGRRVRALQPLAAADTALLAAVGRGEFLVNGFRNRDLRSLLYADATTDATEQRRRSAAVTRQLRLLRAHGVIQKVAPTHRYQVTEYGRTVIAALAAARAASVKELTAAA